VSATIVVGYDDEEPARRALDRAIEEARQRQAAIVVVAVAEMPLNPEGPQSFSDVGDSRARMLPLVVPPELEPVLARAGEQGAAAGIPVDFLWAAGEPAAAIVAAAQDRKAVLVVVGKHHHGFLMRFLGTDVAAEVEREAGCPVIVV
jgi:nucleotide-binding universal stress UspA family protein